MFRIKNSRFIHIPKTAGTFVTNVLGASRSYDNKHAVPERDESIKTFGFVRNPLTWYESWIWFSRNGSEIFRNASQNPLMVIVGNDTHPEKALECLLFPSEKLKETALKLAIANYRVQWVTDLLLTWRGRDVSFYENMIDYYLPATDRVGKVETIRDDLRSMLAETGDLTDEIEARLNSERAVNVTVGKGALGETALREITKRDGALMRRLGYEC